MRRLLTTALLLLAVGAGSALAAFPNFIAKTGFVMPSGNIVCNAGPIIDKAGDNTGKHTLACVLLSQSGVKGQKIWYLRDTGPAAVTFVQGNAATDLPELAYGKSWHWQGFSCSSRTSGLACRARSGHGFFLSRERQRRF